MSDTRSDLSLPKQEAGLLFRTEMWATSFFIGYWKHMATVVVLGLLGVLIYGEYSATWRRHQRAMTADIAEQWTKLPAQAIPGQLTDAQSKTIQSVADDLVKLGKGDSGPAAAEAYLKAAELYRILGKTDQQKAALEGAVPYAKGPLYYAARSSLANIATEKGDDDTAIKIYQQLMNQMDGYLAQQAALNLGMTYESLGRDSDARSVYVQFQSRWPNSSLEQQVQQRLDRLSATPEAPAPAPGGATPAPSGGAASAPSGSATPAPSGNATPAPSGSAAPAPAPAAPAPSGATAPAPAAPAPTGSAAPASAPAAPAVPAPAGKPAPASANGGTE